MPHSSLAIGNEFISRANGADKPLTHMQIQKLVFLSHGWNLALNGTALIEDEFEAWEFGPVVRKLYDALKRHGRDSISQLINWGDDTPFPGDDAGQAHEVTADSERDLIDSIHEAFGGVPAFRLSAITHAPGSPWESVYKRGGNHVIPNEQIKDYFARLADDQRPEATADPQTA